MPIKEKGKQSFEALAGIAYRPENIQVIERHHREIVDTKGKRQWTREGTHNVLQIRAAMICNE